MTLHDLHRPLGTTGLRVSPLGLGTVKLGRDQQVKYPTAFRIPNDQEAANLLAQAQDLGINLLDTAPAYGNSEERLGQLLRKQRQRWVLISKVGEEFIGGQSVFDFSPAHARLSLERSLKRLHTDHLELLLIHSNGDDLAIIRNSGLYETLAAFKQAGLIGGFGLSGKTLEGGLLGLAQSDCAMVTYNLTEQSERPILDAGAEQNKGILIKKALASGHLCTGATQEDAVRASLALVFSHPATTSAIIGTLNPTHLAQNVRLAAALLQTKSAVTD